MQETQNAGVVGERRRATIYRGGLVQLMDVSPPGSVRTPNCLENAGVDYVRTHLRSTQPLLAVFNTPS